MSSPLQDGSIATNDVIEAVHINQLFPILADLEDGKAFFRPDQGSANAYQVDFSGTPSNKNQFSAYHQGMLVIFKAANTNTGASTLQVVGPSGNLTALPLTKSGSVALEADDIQAGQMVAAVCNDLGGGNFRFEMVGAPAVNLTAGDIPSGVDASKIGAGSVSNTEFGYLNNASGNIQEQLNSLINAIVRPMLNGTGGTLLPGQVVYMAASDQAALAQANNSITSRGVGMVLALIDSSVAYVQCVGNISLPTGQWDALTGETGGLTPGAVYYLSPTTAGALTATAPSSSGQFVLKVLLAISSTSAKLIFDGPHSL